MAFYRKERKNQWKIDMACEWKEWKNSEREKYGLKGRKERLESISEWR